MTNEQMATAELLATGGAFVTTLDDIRKLISTRDERIAALEAELAQETKRANYLMHLLENVERMARGEDPLPDGVRIVEIKTDGTNGGVR